MVEHLHRQRESNVEKIGIDKEIVMEEVVVKECGLISSRDRLETAIKDSREMLNRSVRDSSKIVVETALHLIVNTIANNYKLYKIDKEEE